MIKSRKCVIRILKTNGFQLVSSNSHEKWTNGKNIVIIPHKHRDFHVVSHKIILKRAGLI
jgi:predicted RNA binding protein YcfA (HicA-like mRNA interferase family)